MDGNQIQIISDENGIAFLGDPDLIHSFLEQQGIEEETSDLELERLTPVLSALSAGTSAFGVVAENSGKWLKMTDESAAAVKALGPSVSKTTGLMHGVVRAEKGQIAKHLQFVPNSSTLLSPAILTGTGGIMAQIAMEQQMAEINDYLEKIDLKLDQVLQGQKDSILSELGSARAAIDEALTIRESTGKVLSTNWSKVQGTSSTLYKTQEEALRRLEAVARDLELKDSVGALLEVIKPARAEVKEWLAVLAQTFRLHDGFSVLELDRVLDESPEDLENYRQGLITARTQRLSEITEVTELLLDRIEEAAELSNGQHVLKFRAAPSLVRNCTATAEQVVGFQRALGIEDESHSIQDRTFLEALRGVKDETAESISGGLESTKNFGEKRLADSKAVKKRLADEAKERRSRRRDQKIERLLAERDQEELTKELE